MYHREKGQKKYTQALQKYQFSTPTPLDLTIRDAYSIGLYVIDVQK